LYFVNFVFLKSLFAIYELKGTLTYLHLVTLNIHSLIIFLIFNILKSLFAIYELKGTLTYLDTPSYLKHPQPHNMFDFEYIICINLKLVKQN